MRNPLATIAWASRIVLAKRTVPRLEPPFEIDLDVYHGSDYEKIIPELVDMEHRLKGKPADRRGMRWIHQPDGTVLFHGERVIDVPYADFITRVPIGHVGQFYRDSLGMTTQVVQRDEQDRSVHQGVRIIALPQPNYAAFMGKVELDVYKLEKIDYTEDEQRVWMLTVHSPNGSAVCDDGYMSFKRTNDGRGTVVSFMSCQNFPVPPLMALLRLDRWAWFRTLATEMAYRRFCDVMMDNVQDCYNGTDFHVGRALR
ncbi:hypothetical protein [Crossiella cryophila]|uniref:Uncharacterized protein n=1 Tax=Crossiella cryophila TaxID=43355 RepID=A0A7W7FZP6_9PSEU|nr:hypothetical protein [Crossiella cryophila]MBB4681399.1 hypothetical protein [Crossiella cryophila]